MSRMTIGEAFAWLAAQDPDRLAVRDDQGSLTRAQLERQSNQWARAFAEAGVEQDDMVSVDLPNGVDFVLACVAIWKLGATPQPLARTLEEEEKDRILRLARSRALVTDRPLPRSVAAVLHPPGDLTGLHDAPLPRAAAACWKAPTSSGSTGTPKMVKATAGAWIDPEQHVTTFIPRLARQLVAGPMHHSAAFTYAFRGLMTGHSLIIHPRFREERVLQEIGESRISWMMLAPTMMHRILRLSATDRAQADLSSLESILHIGAPCAPELKRAWIDWLGPERVVEVYAGSESQGLCTITGTKWLTHPGSVGRPAGGSRTKVVDRTGQDLPPGEVGEILMTRDGGPTYEYLGAASRRRGEWDTLGDTGYMDSDGYVYLLDRTDDVITSDCVNIYPTEIERVLERHPHVRSAVAFSIHDVDHGQRIEALVDIAESPTTAKELHDWLRHRLEPPKRPKHLSLTRSPVRNDAGKTNRRHLARQREEMTRSP